MFNNNIPKFGEIYYAELEEKENSHIQGRERPVIIAQNNAANTHSPIVSIIPLTGSMKKKPLPVHVDIGEVPGLTKRSVALVEQLHVIDKKFLKNKVASLPNEMISKIGDAMKIQFPFFT